MYKLLPFVAAVAAEEFMGRSLNAAAAKPEGMGFDIATSAVIRTGHGYSGGEKLLYTVCADGKAQHPLVSGTEYVTVAVTGDNALNHFTLKKADGTAITLTAATATDYTAQTECATWTQNFGTGVACGSLQTVDGGGTETAAAVGCATKVAASGTGDSAVAKHWKFTLADGHALDAQRVRYTCGKSATDTAACLENMADGSYYTAAKVGTSTTEVTLKADGATANFDGGDTITAAKNAIAAAGGAAAHSFQKVGASWKSITTTAKPAAGSSNFHVMVATVFSAFFYLMM